MRAVVIPMAAVFLLFFFVVTSVPQLMNSVLTEKTSRISEVLLGSLSPTELMTGKLLGSVAVSLLLGTVYLTAGLSVAGRMGYAGAVPPSLIAWFLVFLVLAMLLYGSVSMAIGAACNDVKDAQNLMLPVMLPLMMPMMIAAPGDRVAVEHAVGGDVAVPAGDAAGDAAARGAASGGAGVAGGDRRVADAADDGVLHLGRGAHLPRRPAHAGQVGEPGADGALDLQRVTRRFDERDVLVFASLARQPLLAATRRRTSRAP